MTESSSQGIGFAFAIQSAKGARVTNSASFKKVRVLSASIGIQQAMANFPVEVGGNYHPGGAYKLFGAGAGTVRWSPRLDGDLGYMLYALLGGVQSSGTSTGGVYSTTFRPRTDFYNHPWLTARRYIPNSLSTSQAYGEEIWDAKFAGMTLSLAPASPAVMDFNLLAISASGVSTASTWDTAMTDEYEDTSGVIMAPSSVSPIIGAVTGVDVGGGVNTAFSVPTIQLQVSIVNTFSGTGIRPELIIGSYGMDDLVLLTQAASIDLIYKWRDPRLLAAIQRYGASSYAWSPTVLQPSMTLTFRSPKVITGSTYQELALTFTNVALDCPEGIVQEAGDFLRIRVMGSVVGQQTATSYMTATIRNARAYNDLPDAVSYTA